MTLTDTTQNELQSKELKTLIGYNAIIIDERDELLRISKNPFRSRLTRIRARKEVFKLEQEITAKLGYMAEIQRNINLLKK